MVDGAAELMRLYERLGTRPTWTCAPYQHPGGPEFGDHIAVGESNAVSYYNSVVGARTNKYGDYLDVACALTGLAPDAGLHRDEHRVAELHIDCTSLPEQWRREDIFAHLIGHITGRLAGRRVPVISGLPADAPKHALKAISSAAASSGGVELWHGAGVTPEAPERGAVLRGTRDAHRHARMTWPAPIANSPPRATARSMRWRSARRISRSPNSANSCACSTAAR